MPFVLPSAPCIPPLGHHVQFIDSRSDLIGHAFRRCPLRTDERLPASPFLAQHGSAVVAGTIASTNSPGLSTARPSALRWRRHVQVVKEPRSSALLSPFLVRFARTQKGHLSCSREDWFDWWPCPISSSSTPRAALIGCEVRIPHCATYGKGGQ